MTGRFSLMAAAAVGWCVSVAWSIPAPGDTAHAAARFIPASKDIPGFTVVNGPAFYGPQNLWDYIDGGALPYLDYGVRDVAAFTAVCAPDTVKLDVDVYDMGDPLGAFGIYSTERDPGARFLSIGAEGYIAESALFFWKDRCYVKIVAAHSGGTPPKSLETVARAIERRIGGTGGMPRLLSLFPAQERVARSEKYIAKDVLGQDFLKRAFTAEYNLDGTPYRLFLIESADSAQAKENFRGCAGFIRDSGGIDDTALHLGDEAFAGKESFYGRVIFARKERYILASVGLADASRAKKILTVMIGKLDTARQFRR